MSNVVLFETLTAGQEFQLGVATLNQPAVLNSLSLEMAELLQKQLSAWERDDKIVAVIIKGAGEKAFCAGGDLHGLYKAMQENTSDNAWNNRTAREFFATEYRLDYHIHTYSKPVICLAHGIVMGGGMGLMIGASHRVVTAQSRLAMPEVSIALFPDVGGSWMLNRLPGNTGKFLAATVASIGAQDALFTGLANYAVDYHNWTSIVEQLQGAEWKSSASRRYNDDLIHAVLSANPSLEIQGTGPIEEHYALINKTCAYRDPVTQYEAIMQLKGHSDAWLAKAAETLARGSPLSFALAMDLLEQTRHDSLAEVFYLEFNVALYCCVYGQFQEGIRALLIDKDRQPNWQPATIAEVSQELVEHFYEDPMPDGEPHPLQDLLN